MAFGRVGPIAVAVALIGLLTLGTPAFANGPTAPIPAPNPPLGYTLVLDLTFHAINDEDSGCVGYWALDHYSENVQVWKSPEGGIYYGFRTYDGGYHTYAGALSPGNGVTQSHDVAGNFNGYVEFKFHAFSDSPFSGHINTQHYGGSVSDILLGTYGAGQTGAPTPYDWRGTYFSGFSNENDLSWAFYYYQGNDLGWTDAFNLPCNTGDIVA